MFSTKVLTVVVLCWILEGYIGLAQGVYITANAGYSLGAGTQFLDKNRTFNGTTTFDDGVFGSYGEGLKFGVSGGYMFNENLGTELGLSYWRGRTFEFTQKLADRILNFNWSGSGFVAVPSIVFSANMKMINPYVRFGLVVGILKMKQEFRSDNRFLIEESTWEETGGLAFGYAGALGVDVLTGGTVDVFAEVDLHSVTYSPSRGETTRYTVNGVDQLGNLPPQIPKLYDFKDSYYLSEQTTMMSVRRPFSSIGIVVGARVNL